MFFYKFSINILMLLFIKYVICTTKDTENNQFDDNDQRQG